MYPTTIIIGQHFQQQLSVHDFQLKLIFIQHLQVDLLPRFQEKLTKKSSWNAYSWNELKIESISIRYNYKHWLQLQIRAINWIIESTWRLKVMKYWCQGSIVAGFLTFSEFGSLPFPSIKISFVNWKMDSRDRLNPPLNPFLSFLQGLFRCLLLQNLALSLVFLVVIQNSSSGGLLLLLLLLLLICPLFFLCICQKCHIFMFSE